MAGKPTVRVLTLGGVKDDSRRINLKDLGFVGNVSDQARAEILANERRAAMVITTAERFWFR